MHDATKTLIAAVRTATIAAANAGAPHAEISAAFDFAAGQLDSIMDSEMSDEFSREEAE